MCDDYRMSKAETNRPQTVFPFAAVVGQDLMRLSLMLNAVNPGIGGVLIRGERGTAKSTAVRGLAAVLPEIEVAGCRYGCDPNSLNICVECETIRANNTDIGSYTRQVQIVDLPVSATEDRVVGTLDLEAALSEGRREFEPGLLAAAHRGVLYVDEVNLLDDHLVDTLLDSAASGVNLIEREGVQYRHPSEYILVGTMNPEEGDLRPQLLDRFGLAAEIRGDLEPEARATIVKRRIDFESDPRGFIADWAEESNKLRDRIVLARKRLPEVTLSDEMLTLITHISITMGVDGHRADIVMHKTASTIASWEERHEVTREDVRRAAEIALPHRRRRDPFTPPHLDEDELNQAIQSFDAKQASETEQGEETDHEESSSPTDDDTTNAASNKAGTPTASGAESHIDADSMPESPTLLAPGRLPITRPKSGRRTQHEVQGRRGRSVRSRPMKPGDPPDVSLIDTIRAAALREPGEAGLSITRADIRIRRRMRKVGNLMLFVVDGSGSMAAQRRMQLTKSAVLGLLADAYQHRDRVGLVTFRKTDAHETVPPTTSLDLAHARMREMPTGGRTPLAHGLDLARRVILRERSRDTEIRPIVILLTDGVANVGLNAGSDPMDDAQRAARQLALNHIPALVVDADRRRARVSPLPDLAQAMAATHVQLEAIAAGQLTKLIRLSST
jgi:magnesium chelatase subunit D